MGEVEEAERALRVAEATVGIGPVAPVLARLPFLFEDRAMAQAAADRFADAPVGGAWEQAAPFLLAYAARAPMPADASAVIDRLSSLPHAGARFKCMIHAILAETLCAFGHHEDAMGQIERLDAARTIDLLWFDRCRTLGPLRTNERFLEIRAGVAGRAAAVFA